VSDGVAKAGLQPGRAEVSASFDEHEVGEPAVTRMRKGALVLALLEPVVEDLKGGCIERHGAFVVELAQWDPQPRSRRAVVHDAVELEVEQFPDPQAGA